MQLKDTLNLNKGSLVSIVGAGGKTSFMFSLGEELRKENKILLTTTTKIYIPEKEQYDYMAIGEENFLFLNNKNDKGIYVYGKSITEENKISGLTEESLEKISPYFEYIIVEADGSKRKPIKGWGEYEPVVPQNTNKTIGVLSIEVLGKEINGNIIHRIGEFMEITASKKGDIIDEETILSLIFHPKGLFKNSQGERILFINKVECAEQEELAQKLSDKIKKRNEEFLLIDKIIVGSLKNKKYDIAFC